MDSINDIVKAIRDNPLIGRGSPSMVNNCMGQDDIIEECERMELNDVKAAVEWFVGLEDLRMDQMMNCRSGEDTDEELVIYREWNERKKEAGF